LALCEREKLNRRERVKEQWKQSKKRKGFSIEEIGRGILGKS